MPRATEPRPLTKTEARRIWLHAQRLDTNEPFGAGPQAVAAAVDHLGYVQIDTIHVIERCHHHILYSRIPGYARADLRRAQSVDKSVFEYWTHALSYVPPKPARSAEITAYQLDRALRAQGLVSLDSICHLDAPSKAAVRRLIEARVRRGELAPVALEGAGKQEHWARPEVLEPNGSAPGS